GAKLQVTKTLQVHYQEFHPSFSTITIYRIHLKLQFNTNLY
ncbi:4081_t:CDS:1, partial [Ambispora gerdemannii]